MAEYYWTMLCYKIVISYQNMTYIARQRKTKEESVKGKKKNQTYFYISHTPF